MAKIFRLLTIILTAMVSLTCVTHAPAWAQQPPLEGVPLGLEMLHQLNATKSGADSITDTMPLVILEDEYCIPPDTPNKDQEEQFLKAREKTLKAHIDRYNALRPRFLTLFGNDGWVRNAVLQKLPAEANPAEDIFWQPWRTAFAKAAKAIQDKRKELASKPVKPCRPPPPPPPPPPPSTDPGIPLPKVEVRPAEIPTVPSRFCTQAEKQAAINSLTAVGFDFYLNFQNAREYHDAIDQAIKNGKGNVDVLRRMLPQAKQNLDFHTGRHNQFERELARVRAMPVVDCGGAQPPPPAPPEGFIPAPEYEMFVWPAVPDRFCSEQEKQSVLTQLDFAKKASRRNYEKAKAYVAEVERRMSSGDTTPGLGEALEQGRRSATTFFNLEIKLDGAYQKAKAMPVVDCGPPASQGRGVLRGADAGAEAGTTAPPPPPPPPPSQPATGTGKSKEVGIRYEGGYIETDTPQQFIGRIVIGGDDNAMIYTSPTLAGFYAQAEADVWDQSLRYAGEFGGFRLAASYSDVEGDEFRRVEADPTITTGFLWINPLEPGLPFAVGLGGTNLAWDARTSTEEIDAAAMALYVQYRQFSSDLVVGVGVGVMADYRNTEHKTRIENLDFAGFAVDENYDFETFALGPRIEGYLDWGDHDPDEDGPLPPLRFRLRAFAAATHDWRSSEVSQRATGPFFGGFDVSQRAEFDDDGFNFRYGVDATLDLKFDERTTAFLKVGWQGQSDAPTIVPADGSVPPGVPIRADTQEAGEWFIGGGVRIQF